MKILQICLFTLFAIFGMYVSIAQVDIAPKNKRYLPKTKYVLFTKEKDVFTLVDQETVVNILVSGQDWKGGATSGRCAIASRQTWVS